MAKLLEIVAQTTVSNAQARRILQTGGVKMNGIQIKDPDQNVPRGTAIDIGKRRLVSGDETLSTEAGGERIVMGVAEPCARCGKTLAVGSVVYWKYNGPNGELLHEECQGLTKGG